MIKKKYFLKRNNELYTEFTKEEILKQVDITKPGTFLPFLEQMDYPFVQEEYELSLKYEKNFSFAKYIARMRLIAFKRLSYKDSVWINNRKEEVNLDIN